MPLREDEVIRLDAPGDREELAISALSAAKTRADHDDAIGRSMGERASDVVRPEEFDDIGGSDDTYALLKARDAALARKAPLVLSAGNYALAEPMEVGSLFKLKIEPGAKLIAADGFTGGTQMIKVGSTSTLAEDVYIGGGGHINARNLVETGIEFVYGRFSKVADLSIIGCDLHAVLVGDDAAAGTSYEINLRDLWIFYNDIANDQDSIGVYFRNVSDSYLKTANIIGYRKGVRTERGSIEQGMVHAWIRPAHGTFTHGFDLDGNTGTLSQCYADTPTNYGKPTETDVYGFYIDGSGTLLSNCRVFMNTTLTPDIGTDDALTAFYIGAGRPVTILAPYISGASASKRYRKYFDGDLGNLTVAGAKINATANLADLSSMLSDLRATGAAVADLPAAGQDGEIRYVSNGNAGQPCLAVWSSDGWKRVGLGANVSAS